MKVLENFTFIRQATFHILLVPHRSRESVHLVAPCSIVHMFACQTTLFCCKNTIFTRDYDNFIIFLRLNFCK